MTIEQAKEIVNNGAVTCPRSKQLYLTALKVLSASAFSPR